MTIASLPSGAVTNAGTFAVQAASTIVDGASVTLGAKADAKSTATDTTPATVVSILKQISASVQAPPPYNYTPVSPGQFGLGVVSSTALTIPSGALQAVISVEGNSVRYTYDGTTTPTATVGHLLTAGQSIQFSGSSVLANLKFIQIAATATINVSYTK